MWDFFDEIEEFKEDLFLSIGGKKEDWDEIENSYDQITRSLKKIHKRTWSELIACRTYDEIAEEHTKRYKPITANAIYKRAQKIKQIIFWNLAEKFGYETP